MRIGPNAPSLESTTATVATSVLISSEITYISS